MENFKCSFDVWDDLYNDPMGVSDKTSGQHGTEVLAIYNWCHTSVLYPRSTHNCVYKGPSGEAGKRAQVKNTGCSCREPGFNSQHPYGGSQLPLIPIPRDPMPSSLEIWWVDKWAGKIPILTRKNCFVWQDSSSGQAPIEQAWEPEFNPWISWWKREPPPLPLQHTEPPHAHTLYTHHSKTERAKSNSTHL